MNMFLVACEFFFCIMVLNWILYFVFVHGCLPRTICSDFLVLSGSRLLEHGQTGHTVNMQLMQSHTSRNQTYQWRRYANAPGVL